MNVRSAVAFAVLCLSAVLVFRLQGTSAVTCDVTYLSPCMGAVIGGAPPIPECCQRLKEQQPCFCGYIKDPILAPYISSPNANKTLDACGVPHPRC
ncbi:non-specific lipid-transfer protein 2-like [Dorcoceras hygrometricum]|uniref:Non-specific lipid-transfer protein 2-like n=1 Tax=Dorcoceras hygrometricum TaxID=472368 RepID=A0A2Z7C6X6_9LAMI|nr:non-specific lipid-transfer protein 2-like [Dorcoceras hygrometricum]